MGALNIIENVNKRAPRDKGMTKTEAKRSTRRHAKTVPWWDNELQQIKSLRNKCLNLYGAYRNDEQFREEYCR